MRIKRENLVADFDKKYDTENEKQIGIFFRAISDLEKIGVQYLKSDSTNPVGMGAAFIIEWIDQEIIKKTEKGQFLEKLSNWRKPLNCDGDCDNCIKEEHKGGEC